MGYEGQIAGVRFGNGGLHTDDPQSKIPSTDLIDTNNIEMIHGFIEKASGSLRYNKNVLPAGVVGIKDWWPTAIIQRIMAVCRDGKVYRFTNGFLPFTEVTPISDGSPATLTVDTQTMMVHAGNESTNLPRKLFIFSQSAPQVIDGDGKTRRLMTKPALDWLQTDGITPNSNQPFFGIVYRNSLWCFGNRNNPHTIYRSNAEDHDDFQTLDAATFYTIYSGDSERLISAFVFKSALYVLKYPTGLYQLIDSDPSPSNWYFVKIQSDFGGASQHCTAAIINDMFIANQNGMISSGTATIALGNIKAGEVLNELRNQNYVRENMAQDGLMNRQCVYYADKNIFMATYQSSGGIKNDRILYIDISNQQLYKTYWGDKDQANCISLKKDGQLIPRPFYGSDDGYIYDMDRRDRLVGSNGYEMIFQTPHMDLSFVGQSYQTVGTSNSYISDTTKFFDFLELDYIPTGAGNLNVEVILDGKTVKNMTFDLGWKSDLDTFILDQNKTDSEVEKQKRKPLDVFGRRISLRCTNDGPNENCQIVGFNIYFRVSAQQSEGNK